MSRFFHFERTAVSLEPTTAWEAAAVTTVRTLIALALAMQAWRALQAIRMLAKVDRGTE